MLSLLVTSVIISQTVFSFLPVGTSFTARQAHTVAAYGALLIVALHLGLQWSMIMGLVRGRLGFKANNRLACRGFFERLALGIAAYGVHSLHRPECCLEALDAGAYGILRLSSFNPGATGSTILRRRTGDLSFATMLGNGGKICHRMTGVLSDAVVYERHCRRTRPGRALGFAPSRKPSRPTAGDDPLRKKAPELHHQSRISQSVAPPPSSGEATDGSRRSRTKTDRVSA